MKYRNRIFQGHALEVLATLPEDCVDCVVTSPPYWGLRDYQSDPLIWGGDPSCEHEFAESAVGLQHENRNFQQGSQEEVCGSTGMAWIKKYDKLSAWVCPKCGAWKGALGLEPTFDMFVDHLCQVFEAIKRVLKPTGTLWVNLGDTFSSSTDWTRSDMADNALHRNTLVREKAQGLPSKCLCLVPFRFAIAMLEHGWICRNVIIWRKPNCAPQSAKDRFTVDFEYFFLFSQREQYYFEQQFEPSSKASVDDLLRRTKMRWTDGSHGSKHHGNEGSPYNREGRSRLEFYGSQGRNKRAVWDVRVKPFKGAHFAVFPPSLIKTPIEAGCPEFVCRRCGKPRVRLYEKVKGEPSEVYRGQAIKNYAIAGAQNPSDMKRRVLASMAGRRKFKGWEECGCAAGWRPGVVLDPFMGAGTTALVALKLRREFIGIELNSEYIAIAEKRIDPHLNQKRLTEYV